MNLFDTDSILDDDPPGMTILHDREYRVRAYRKADDRYAEMIWRLLVWSCNGESFFEAPRG